MSNQDKIKLLKLRLRALDRETETLEMLVGMSRLMRNYERHRVGFEQVRSLIDAGKAACEEELKARNNSESRVRRAAVATLRATEVSRYGFHKVANVELESIRSALDAFEKVLDFDREDAVLMFNTMSKRWRIRREVPTARVIAARGPYDRPKVMLGEHIRINGRFGESATEAELLDFHSAILRDLRRIAQTEVGQTLLAELDAAATRLKPKYLSEEAMLEILCGSSSKDWLCKCYDQDGATRAGKPTVESIPQRRGARPGSQRGTGTGSRASVRTYPAETMKIGPSAMHESTAFIPTHVALYHELTHALHGMKGTQDHTSLSERPKELGDTFAHSGFWYTQEEKTTVAAEKEYSEQTGFNLKRLNYGALATRIDK